jgi:hypothetical protein
VSHLDRPGIRKFGQEPEYERKENGHVQFKYTDDAKGDKNLLNTAQASKVVNPLTRALVPPFIGRRRDFYIPKTPSSLKNIPNVNMYTNVFYISYIYKPATSSHTKSELFETASLTWLLTDSRISPFRKSSCAATSELDLQQILKFRRLPISWFCRFMTSSLHKFATLELRRFKIPDLRKFTTSELRRFKIPDLRRFKILENSFHEFHTTRRFEGDRFS